MNVRPSTHNLIALPSIDDVKRISKAAAMLDAILQPEWDLRYFSYYAHWADGEEMGAMRTNEGDDYFILFSPAGAIILGYAKESVIAAELQRKQLLLEGIFDGVPDTLQRALMEPAFSVEDTTFCIWRRYMDSEWHIGPVRLPEGNDSDGSEDLLYLFDGEAETYATWADEYFEEDIVREVVEQAYHLTPLTEQMVHQLNPHRQWDELSEDIVEIGYPMAG